MLPNFLRSKAESGIYDAVKAEAAASKQRISQINDSIKLLDEQIQVAAGLSEQRDTAVIIESIPDLVPEGVELSAYYLSDNAELRIRGAARSPSMMTLFVTELQNSGLVEPPIVGEPIYREGSQIFDFEITTRLRQES